MNFTFRLKATLARTMTEKVEVQCRNRKHHLLLSLPRHAQVAAQEGSRSAGLTEGGTSAMSDVGVRKPNSQTGQDNAKSQFKFMWRSQVINSNALYFVLCHMSSDLYAICFAFKRRFVKVRNYFLFCLTALQLKIFIFLPTHLLALKKVIVWIASKL